MSFVPLYQQIKERIVREVLSESARSENGRLPTERQLETRFGVSRPTISKAIAALAAEGLLVKSPGRGMFAVNPPAPPAPSSWRELENQPIQTSAVDWVYQSPDLFDELAEPDPRSGPSARRIGFVAPLASEALVRRSFCGIDRAAHRRGYHTLLASSRNDISHERIVASELIASGAQGLVIYPVPRTGAEESSDYLNGLPASVPVVLIDTCTPEQGHTQVVFDNRRAGYDVTNWLLSEGRQRIALLSYAEEIHHRPLAERRRGYVDALNDHGVRFRDEWIQRFTPGAGSADVSRAVEFFLSLDNPPDAIIAADDITALAVIQELAQHGVRHPEDIQVAGFDDREAARAFSPTFTTTKPEFERMGEMACELLLDAISGAAMPDRIYVLGAPLLIREHRLTAAVRQKTLVPKHLAAVNA